MKTIQITKREQLVLMTVVRVAIRALRPARMQEAVKIERGMMMNAMQEQPGFESSPTGGQLIPAVDELESILERLGDEGKT